MGPFFVDILKVFVYYSDTKTLYEIFMKNDSIFKQKNKLSCFTLLQNEDDSFNDERLFFFKDMLNLKDGVQNSFFAIPSGSFLEDLCVSLCQTNMASAALPLHICFHRVLTYLTKSGCSIQHKKMSYHPQSKVIFFSDAATGKTSCNRYFDKILPGFSSEEDGFIEEFSHMYKPVLCNKLSLPDNILGFVEPGAFKSLYTVQDVFTGLATGFVFVESGFANLACQTLPEADSFKKKMDSLLENAIHKEYISSEDNDVRTLLSKFYPGLSDVTVQMLSKSLHAYALTYHVLLGKGQDAKLDSEDYAWAARLMVLFIQDALFALNLCGLKDFKKYFSQVQSFMARNPEASLREMVQGVNAIKNMEEARMITQLLKKLTMGA